jgi:predicted transcriptional regulator
MSHSFYLYIVLRSSTLSIRARVCACVGLFGGIDRRSIERFTGLAECSVSVALTGLVRSGAVNRVRSTVHGVNGGPSVSVVRYHDTKEARRIVRSELEQLDKIALDLVNELRQHPRIKQDKLDRLLGILPDVEE